MTLARSSTVAALYVDPRGVYSTMSGVELWDEARDARTYAGPHPVVAHPPCHLWTNLAHVNFKRYGGEHNRPGNDGGCFSAALRDVLAYGGVIEHPAESRAWSFHGLPRPAPAPGWQGGWVRSRRVWVCEVWQSAYGHRARKRTWLMYRGGFLPPQLRWERAPGTHQCGWFDRNKPTLSKRDASATPPAFAAMLVELARSSRSERRAG